MSSFKDKILQYLKKYSEKANGNENSQEKTTVKPTSIESEAVITSESSSKSKKDFLSEMEKLDNMLQGVKEDYLLEKIEYQPLSDEEITKMATDDAENKYALKSEELKKQTAQKRNDLVNKNEIVKNSGEAKKSEISKAYDELGEKVESNAIKRGIARSSIIAEQLKSLDVEKIKDFLSVDNAVATQIKENNDKIEALESEYKSAVSNLNVNKAIEIKEQIEKYKEKQNQKIEEVIKYNNSLIDEQLKINEKVAKNPLTGDEAKEVKRQMVSVALEYYLSLPKEERLSEFNKDFEIKNMLGEYEDFVQKYLEVTK